MWVRLPPRAPVFLIDYTKALEKTGDKTLFEAAMTHFKRPRVASAVNSEIKFI
jgi:hypothetical protein